MSKDDWCSCDVFEQGGLRGSDIFQQGEISEERRGFLMFLSKGD